MVRRETDIRARVEAVDLAKLAAAAAVVWIHVTNCATSRELLPLCRFAVPFFTCAAVYFVLHKVSSARVPFRAYCLERARRLYVPFLVWSAIYLAARLVKHFVLGFGSPIVFSPALLLNGTTHHLWFLPFICLISVVTFGLANIFGTPQPGREPRWMLAFLIAGSVLAELPCPIILETTAFPLSYFVDHLWDALPSAFFGAALFMMLRIIIPGTALRAIVLVIGVFSLFIEFASGIHPLAAHLAGASLLFLTCTQANRDWMKSLWPWAQLAFVIYLVHVLFVEALQAIANRFGSTRSLAADLSVWALSFVFSAVIAKALSLRPSFHWIFPR